MAVLNAPQMFFGRDWHCAVLLLAVAAAISARATEDGAYAPTQHGWRPGGPVLAGTRPSVGEMKARRRSQLTAPIKTMATAPSSPRLYVVEVSRTVYKPTLAGVERLLGRRVLGYIPDRSYLVLVSEAEARTLNEAAYVDSVTELGPTERISFELEDVLAGVDGADVDGIEELVLDTRLVPAEHHQLSDEGVAAVIRTRLAQCGIEDAQVRLAGPSRLRVVCGASVGLWACCVEGVAGVELVQWVEELEEMRSMNKYSRRVLQSGTNDAMPLYELGLTGAGRVVMVSDTGIDGDHCFFKDPEHPFPYDAANLNHRKVIRYISFANGLDDQGHGSHTAGTCAGKALFPDSASIQAETAAFNGAAYDSKIVYFDIGTPAGALVFPDDLQKDFFGVGYDLGARVFSDSWGSGRNTNSAIGMDIDTFSFNHPDALLVFAGGNDGQRGLYTVSSPSTAKNCLSVGSVQNSYKAFEEKDSMFNSRVHISSPQDIAGEYPAHPGAFGPRFLGATLPVVLSSPLNGCAALRNAAEVSGKVVLILRGVCEFITKVRFAESAGAAGVIIYNDRSGNTEPMGAGGKGTTGIPSAMIRQDIGLKIVGYLESGTEVLSNIGAQSPPDYSSSSDYSVENVAYFSSMGPTIDGRIKPEIMGPGENIMSSWATRQSGTTECGIGSLYSLSGTSMTTPLVAGHAVLLKQYFQEGYYPSGSKEAQNAFDPTSDLLKALFINSARPLTGNVDHKPISGESKRGYMEGYGRATLANVLPLPGTSGLTLWLNQREPEQHAYTDDAHHFCFRVRSPSRPFKATLAWLDPPASTNSYFLLVNDLDLLVTAPDGHLYVGNSGARMGDGVDGKRDFVNNHEDVMIEQLGPGQVFVVTVFGANVPLGPQRYSLVVTGDIDVMPTEGCRPPCPPSCNNGACEDGRCVCQDGWFGTLCNRRIQEMPMSEMQEGSSQFMTWDYWSVALPEQEERVSLTATLIQTSSKGGGDADLYVQKGRPPTFHDQGLVDTTETQRQGYTVHRVVFSCELVNQEGPGRYYIGVMNTQLETATYQLRVTTGDCTTACSGHGSRDHSQCLCDPGYAGSDCAKMCPGGPYNGCRGKGECREINRKAVCVCDSEHFGEECQYVNVIVYAWNRPALASLFLGIFLVCLVGGCGVACCLWRYLDGTVKLNDLLDGSDFDVSSAEEADEPARGRAGKGYKTVTTSDYAPDLTPVIEASEGARSASEQGTPPALGRSFTVQPVKVGPVSPAKKKNKGKSPIRVAEQERPPQRIIRGKLPARYKPMSSSEDELTQSDE